jgi:membrane-associated protease RseP (regulator of RpoE activity)
MVGYLLVIFAIIQYMFVKALPEVMSRNVVILFLHMIPVFPITSQVIVPIFILVSLVGLSFAYVGSISNSSLPISSPNQGQPWLGIAAVEVSPQISKEIGLAESSGLLVLEVAPGSPADKAGINGGDNLKVIDGVEIPIGGDVIIRMDGNPIRDLNDFRNYLGNKQVGDNLQFTLATTDDNIRNVDAKLEARPA